MMRCVSRELERRDRSRSRLHRWLPRCRAVRPSPQHAKASPSQREALPGIGPAPLVRRRRTGSCGPRRYAFPCSTCAPSRAVSIRPRRAVECKPNRSASRHLMAPSMYFDSPTSGRRGAGDVETRRSTASSRTKSARCIRRAPRSRCRSWRQADPPPLRRTHGHGRRFAVGTVSPGVRGRLGIIEEFPNIPDRGPGFGGASKIIDSEDLLKLLNADATQRIDARAFLTARLTDLVLNDNDRHEGNWKWAQLETDPGCAWTPIARDRDHAFVAYDGMLPRVDYVWRRPRSYRSDPRPTSRD